jgi:predicted enzyme related to lactoylglutathione lyase
LKAIFRPGEEADMAKHGDWYWHELMTSDPKGGLGFYRAVFGWGESPMQEDYTLMTQHEVPTSGVTSAQPNQPTAWLPYVAVRDIAETKSAIESNGGRVWVGPTETPGAGTWMICSDPQGAPIGVIQPEGGVEG